MDEGLDARSSNYLASVYQSGFDLCVLYCELSTGELRYQNIDRSLISLQEALLEQSVTEVVVPMTLDKHWIAALEQRDFVVSRQKKSNLQDEDKKLLPMDANESLMMALAQLMAYLKDTQKQHIDHFMPMESMDKEKNLIMDYQTKQHLDLFHEGKEMSLWRFMDHCKSAMGSRLLKKWIEMPLLDVQAITQRQKAILTLKNDFILRENLNEHLSYIYDMERLASRMAYGNASPRDVLQLVTSLEHAKPILDLADALDSYPEFRSVPNCQDLYQRLQGAIVEEPPLTMKDGGVFSDGYNEQLDEIRAIAQNGQAYILDIENKERERTGVKSLKIGYNRVFGYYIEVRNGNLDAIKEEFGYHPKQTLANATRYITQELKEKEEQILHAQEEKVRLENQLFKELLLSIKTELTQLHQCAHALATIDVLSGLATLASEKGYVCPTFQAQTSHFD